MRTRYLFSTGLLGIVLGIAGLPAYSAQADEPERVRTPQMAVHNGDGERQNRQIRNNNRRSGDQNARNGNRRGGRNDGNRNRDHNARGGGEHNNQHTGNTRRGNRRDGNRNHNARRNGEHNNQHASNNFNRRDARRHAREDRRHDRRHANGRYRNDRRDARRHANQDRRDNRRHNRAERRHNRDRNYYGGRRSYSNFSLGLGYGSSRYGNRYGYPFYSSYDLFPWWYGNSFGYRSRTSYRSGYGHVGHSNIYCTDPYHQNYRTNWGRTDYRNDQFAYSEYTDGSYGGNDVRDCHRETQRGVYGRRSAIVSTMVCFNQTSGDYEETGAQTLVRYVY